MYLGLRPPKGAFHYPVIRTVKIGNDLELVLKRWDEFTHIIFTSQSAVEYWSGPWGKELIAIGPATAKALPKNSIIAKEATQEGIAELIKGMKGNFFYPRSKRARPFLIEFMKRERIPFFAFDLYDTQTQNLEPVPNIEEFDEIVFTSSSTIDAFLEIFGSLPKSKKLTAIGPITLAKLQQP